MLWHYKRLHSQILNMSSKILESELRIARALDLAFAEGSGAGSRAHKIWLIDQMVRALTGCPTDHIKGSDGVVREQFGESAQYKNWVAKVKSGSNGPNSYIWEIGKKDE